MGKKKKQKINFPQYINTTNRTIEVVGMLETTDDYVDNKGYIDPDGQIWIYSYNKPKHKNLYPFFWKEDGELKFSDPIKIVKSAYHIDQLQDVSMVTIINTTKPNEELFDEEAIEDMNAAAAFFVPIIKPTDDFLKKIVKIVIIEQGIDINKLKAKTGEKYQLANMRAALQNSTKMSVTYFNYWMNLLNCDFTITITDNNNSSTDKLKDPIIYQSYSDNLSKVKGSEIKPINIDMYMKKDREDET